MAAKNRVIAGDHIHKPVTLSFGEVFISTVQLNKQTVADYETVTEDVRKSAASGAVRGLLGSFLLGPVGLVAGGLSAKNKGTYQIAIQFRTGEKSLLEVDDKIYKAIIKACF